jgi:bis(5'-nucleosidyl)-tetraphosphatase
MADKKFKKVKPRKEISAGLIVYRSTKEGPKFLVMYHRGSYWNFPKGKLEPGERSLSAAVRETVEETGLRKQKLRLRRKFRAYERYQFRAPDEYVDKKVTLYLAEARSREVRVSEEHNGYGWFLYKDARRLLSKHKESQEVLRRAYEFIGWKSQRASRQRKPSQKQPQRNRRRT